MTPHDHFNALVALERPIATLNDGRGADPPGRLHQARSPRRRRRVGVGAAMLTTIVAAAVLVSAPTTSRASVPGVDWTNLPAESVDLTSGWAGGACDGDAPVLCTTLDGEDQGIVEHLEWLVEEGDLAADLDASIPVRQALAAEAGRYHEAIRADRGTVCPDLSYIAEPTVGATVAGLDGIRYGFEMFEGNRVVERTVGFMTVRQAAHGAVVDVVAATEINEGACISDEGLQPFRDGSLADFEPVLAQLVARSTFGTGSRPVPQLTEDLTVPMGDRVAVAVAMSQLARPEDGGTETVLIARDDQFADALASGGLQGALDAPLLLTGDDHLDERVAAEIGRLGAVRAIVLGGEEAVPERIATELRGLALTVERVAGADRIATSLAIADMIGPRIEQVVLVRAHGDETDPSRAWADALAAGATAAALEAPVVLTTEDVLDPRVAGWLQAEVMDNGLQSVLVAGGEAAIDRPVLQEIVEIGLGVDRAHGDDRAGTAVELARRRGMPAAELVDTVIVVDGSDWAGGMTAALASDRLVAPVVLTGNTMPAATTAFVGDADVDVVCIARAAACR
ncbi:Serine/threonine protein kinase [Euzebya pacifica]|uniref:Serine/threonine protein kinase n=1 Tax=Euzebya pacifica TaxID=1608957 RepID=A0A346XSC4_9ACTN|nr:cell wall-binding repeat-containing protein [Euzebya pacifica]AXV05121.1 Serine/threonine protein kinase [Euzebya pacifica]